MPTLDAALQLLQAHGLLLLFPLAMVEGPIVTVLAAYLARLGHLNLAAVFIVVIVADLVGDAVLYLVGRLSHGSLPPRWRARLGLDEARQAALERYFRAQRRPGADHRQADAFRRVPGAAGRRGRADAVRAVPRSTTWSARCRRACSSC